MDLVDDYYKDGERTTRRTPGISELLQKYDKMKMYDPKSRFDAMVSMEFSSIKLISITIASRSGLYGSMVNKLSTIDISKERINPVGCIAGYFSIDPATLTIDRNIMNKIYDELREKYNTLTKEYILKYARYWLIKIRKSENI